MGMVSKGGGGGGELAGNKIIWSNLKYVGQWLERDGYICAYISF